LPSQTSFELKYVSVPGYGSNISLKRVWSHWRFAKNWPAAWAAMRPPSAM
jgi:hypothetical protein